MTDAKVKPLHTPDLLSNNPVMDENRAATLSMAERIVDALRSGTVHALNYSMSRMAPTGHPDAFPNGSGVRNDKREVLMVVIEVDDPRYATQNESSSGAGA